MAIQVGRILRVLRRLAPALLVAATIAACGSSSGTSTNPSATGAPDSAFYGVVYPFPALEEADVPRMEEGNVQSVRWNFFWPTMEPRQGDFNWQNADHMVGGLASQGIRILPVLYGSPTYAGSTSTTPPIYSDAARKAWEDFLTAVVKRYGPGGSFWDFYQAAHPDAPVLPIREWQIWNEPNLKHYFTPTPSPTRYAELVQISHDAIKAVDPGAKIVLAGMPGYGEIKAWDFLDQLYDISGFSDNFDIAALHPYAPSVHYLELEVSRMRAALVQNGDADKQLDITEMGWGSNPPDKHGLNQGVQGQAQLLKQSFQLLTQKREPWNIGALYWFEFRDPGPGKGGGCTFCDSAGLLTADGQPKPSWNAYTQFTR